MLSLVMAKPDAVGDDDAPRADATDEQLAMLDALRQLASADGAAWLSLVRVGKVGQDLATVLGRSAVHALHPSRRATKEQKAQIRRLALLAGVALPGGR
jgi:hypothetical protein